MENISVIQYVRYKLLNYAPSVLFSIVVIAVGIFLTKLVKKLIKNAFYNLGKGDSRFLPSILRIIRISIMIICFLLILSKFHVSINAFSTVISSVVIAFGIGLKDFFCGVAKSFQIFTIRPFIPGDIIEIDGKKGVVKQIDYMYTYIINSDQTVIMVPNSLIADKSIVKYRQDENIIEKNKTEKYQKLSETS